MRINDASYDPTTRVSGQTYLILAIVVALLAGAASLDVLKEVVLILFFPAYLAVEIFWCRRGLAIKESIASKEKY